MPRELKVLWLLNHTTLRKFELAQLRSAGVREIFLPKSFPFDEGNLSANIDYSCDADISIPPEELEVMNAQDWYESPSAKAWEIANRHFDLAFIGFFPRQIESVTRNFRGSIAMRCFGLPKGYSYTKLLYDLIGAAGVESIRALRQRFWFAAGYEHLHECEGDLLKSRNSHLPVGLYGRSTSEQWTGSGARIFFVCPRIETSPYFNAVYRKFKETFRGLPYAIGGAQPIAVADPDVLGFVSREQHDRNMHSYRVMFYHSQEDTHIHYHPFEAILSGMPLVFMAGGMLDRFGGTDLPGRCGTASEARKMIGRILQGDNRLIEKIKSSQTCLLNAVLSEKCEGQWQKSFAAISAEIHAQRQVRSKFPRKNMRVAVIVPVGYRGGSLRGAKLLAQAIELGSQQANEPVEVVIGYLDNEGLYSQEDFHDLPGSISRRAYNWQILSAHEAKRAMVFAGHNSWEPAHPHYMSPDDGIQQFLDCQAWVVVSDRLQIPLLPVRPVVLMVYDYLQRYIPLLPHGADAPFIAAARAAQAVMVTTEFTRLDAIHYAGLDPSRVYKMPMLVPKFCRDEISFDSAPASYFLWTTNMAPHKNHANAMRALSLYYEELDGQLDCCVSGVGTLSLQSSMAVDSNRSNAHRPSTFRRRVKFLGELPDGSYRNILSKAAFLWHPCKIDNGTFSVVEAAHMRVPALSSNYPAMREMDVQFGLALTWSDPDRPENMAQQLKNLEREYRQRRDQLPSREQLALQDVEHHAGAYWDTLRPFLTLTHARTPIGPTQESQACCQ